MNTKHTFTIASGVLAIALCASAAAGEVKGIHIPQKHRIGFTHVMTDGGGFRWDIRRSGNVGQGTNYAYSSGLYCQVNGSNISSNGNGWRNKAGDEIEIGPCNRNNLNCYRRVKVYKKLAMARWLDIFENPTSRAITVSVQIYSHTNWGIGQTITTSKGNTFGPKDWAFITVPQGGNNVPRLLHVVCGKKSKLRPTVNIRSNQIYVKWSLTVPAGKTAVLCYFESQNQSIDAHHKLLKELRPYKLLRDLSPGVRKLIVNFPTYFGLDDVELERSERNDIVMLVGGPILGTVTNEKFPMEGTVFGTVSLPAEKVVGMVAGRTAGAVRVLLTDGQILSGRMTGKLVLRLATGGGKLQIPFADIRQWSFRISPKRLEAEAAFSPHAIFATGDRLRIDAGKLELRFASAYGTLPLRPADILHIRQDKSAGKTLAVFLNGSRFSGRIEPAKLTLAMTLGKASDIPREDITRFQFAPEEAENTRAQNVARVVMKNKDELCGCLVEDKLSVRSNYGAINISVGSVRLIEFGKAGKGRAIVRLWDGSTLRGKLTHEHVSVKLAKGITLKLPIGQIVTLARSQAIPAAELVARVKKLIVRLGDNDYKTRQAATEAILKLGPAVVPILRNHKGHDDPEVRRRISDIIQRLE